MPAKLIQIKKDTRKGKPYYDMVTCLLNLFYFQKFLKIQKLYINLSKK
ncbi:hypothetical protein DFQ12_5043 [Sphingobacterium detergens]|uniref:Uncharacterized protein n=1 Tax=Sphingobacterium detergens TaxID=1145106 RepID=A0A420AFM1_SPHD1|nr:hypothetical protein DFQ12_5043 [Sphingobacterium detergens]